MNTIKVTRYDNEFVKWPEGDKRIKEFKNSPFHDDGDWVNSIEVYEDVVMHQVAHEMIQMVFANGDTKILTMFSEIEIIPSDEEKAEFAEQTRKAYEKKQEEKEDAANDDDEVSVD